MDHDSGYLEIEHTADWALRVWAPDLTALLQTAAEGMYALSQTRLKPDSRTVRHFEIPYVDPESLLVDFLSELLFFGEDQGIAFDDYELRISDDRLEVLACGAEIQQQSKEIKAVTYHGMQVRQMDYGLEVRIVFDV
jgi:SHS2 domain-containing protein